MIPDEESRFIQAGWKARLVLFGYVLSMLAITAWLADGFERAAPAPGASQEALLRSVESVRRLIGKFLLITLVHAVFFSGYFLRLAIVSMRSGEFPPAGTWVIVKTRIRSGRKARVSAYASCALAVLVWLPVAIPLYLRWILERLT